MLVCVLVRYADWIADVRQGDTFDLRTPNIVRMSIGAYQDTSNCVKANRCRDFESATEHGGSRHG